jgi:AraC-like DNA-binding protein
MSAHTSPAVGADLSFASADLNATEEFLGRAYTKMAIDGGGESTSTRVTRRWIGRLSYDELEFGYRMSYDANALGRICLCRVQAGHIQQNFVDEPSDVFGPGSVALAAHPDQPYSGTIHAAAYDLTMFGTEELSRVAGPASGRDRVRLLGYRPVSATAQRRLNAAIDYVRTLAGPPSSGVTPLVASTLTAHLAAVVLETFPNNAAVEPTPAERLSAGPALLRQAIGFIEAEAHKDIVLSDIAAAVHVTPRALQYVFRRHLEMSPMEYLRRVRLDHAHRQLSHSDPRSTTVRHIAGQWGFAHTGRFSALYRRTYGHSPSETLRRSG